VKNHQEIQFDTDAWNRMKSAEKPADERVIKRGELVIENFIELAELGRFLSILADECAKTENVNYTPKKCDRLDYEYYSLDYFIEIPEQADRDLFP
jgi:hypothetical protein